MPHPVDNCVVKSYLLPTPPALTAPIAEIKCYAKEKLTAENARVLAREFGSNDIRQTMYNYTPYFEQDISEHYPPLSHSIPKKHITGLYSLIGLLTGFNILIVSEHTKNTRYLNDFVENFSALHFGYENKLNITSKTARSLKKEESSYYQSFHLIILNGDNKLIESAAYANLIASKRLFLKFLPQVLRANDTLFSAYSQISSCNTDKKPLPSYVFFTDDRATKTNIQLAKRKRQDEDHAPKTEHPEKYFISAEYLQYLTQQNTHLQYCSPVLSHNNSDSSSSSSSPASCISGSNEGDDEVFINLLLNGDSLSQENEDCMTTEEESTLCLSSPF